MPQVWKNLSELVCASGHAGNSSECLLVQGSHAALEELLQADSKCEGLQWNLEEPL